MSLKLINGGKIINDITKYDLAFARYKVSQLNTTSVIAAIQNSMKIGHSYCSAPCPECGDIDGCWKIKMGKESLTSEEMKEYDSLLKIITDLKVI